MLADYCYLLLGFFVCGLSCICFSETEGLDALFRADHHAQYDKYLTVDLSTMVPHINGPFTPDRATPIHKFAKAGIFQSR